MLTQKHLSRGIFLGIKNELNTLDICQRKENIGEKEE
jgi:hypothetical protein